MKNGLIALTVALALCVAGSAQAEKVSSDMLSQMGLAGAQQVSDADGMQIRGEGYFFQVGVFKQVIEQFITDVHLEDNVAEALATADAVAYDSATLTHTDVAVATYTDEYTSASSSAAIAISVSD